MANIIIDTALKTSSDTYVVVTGYTRPDTKNPADDFTIYYGDQPLLEACPCTDYLRDQEGTRIFFFNHNSLSYTLTLPKDDKALLFEYDTRNNPELNAIKDNRARLVKLSNMEIRHSLSDVKSEMLEKSQSDLGSLMSIAMMIPDKPKPAPSS